MKKTLIILITMLTIASCSNTNENNKTTEVINIKSNIDKINVTTSIIPLASITNYIGGEFVDTKSLVPAGVSPHGFDLKPNQMVDLEKSNLIIYLGMDHIDGFLDKVVEEKNNVLSVNNGIELLESAEHEHDEEHADEEHTDEEHTDEEIHSIDPHIWSSGENAYIIAKTIFDKLSELNPENKEYFETNLKSFKNEIDLAKKDYEEKTKEKTQNNFIVFHDAYNYLFKELNIDNTKKHIFRTNMLSDPNSNEMKELIDEIQDEGIKVAYKEPQLDSSNLNNISKEYDLEVLVLDPLGKDESSMGYINNYKNNLKNIEKIYE